MVSDETFNFTIIGKSTPYRSLIHFKFLFVEQVIVLARQIIAAFAILVGLVRLALNLVDAIIIRHV